MNTDYQINIQTNKQGWYNGLNTVITGLSKVIIISLVLYAIVLPDQAAEMLGALNSSLLNIFNSYYIISVSFFLIFCLAMIFLPVGKIKLGKDDSEPEFSNFSWFSMMFSAGMGIGLMFYSIGEPMYHYAGNPDVIAGLVEAGKPETVDSAMRFSFLHWGFHAWAIYVSAGLAMGYFAYRLGLPLTIRSTLTPLFGDRLDGPLGHAVDVLAVVATVLGISVTVGTGVTQLISGFDTISSVSWLLNEEGKPTNSAIIAVLVMIMLLSTLSALTGVGRGVKWLSNVNTSLSLILLGVFLVFGSLAFAASTYVGSFIDYLVKLPELSFTVWDKDSDLGQWQTGWTIYYWAWWIAFAPFVGLFLARVSKGRTIREFIMGAMVFPVLVSFVWFALLGGSALDLELQGVAEGAILNASIESKMFITLQQMMSPEVAQLLSVMVVLLIITFLVTSVDSGVLVLNTIMAGGEDQPHAKHRIVWGVILTLVVGSLMFAGGLATVQKAMIIGALPFSMIMLLMCVSTLRAAYIAR